MLEPGVYVGGPLTTTERSDWLAPLVSVTVAVLFVGTGSFAPAGTAAPAMFTRFPVAAGETVAITVNVAPDPDGRFRFVMLMFPLPLSGPPAPPEYVADQVADVM